MILAVFRFSNDVVEESISVGGNEEEIQSVEKKKTAFHALLACDKVMENINKPSRAGITALHAACRRENTIMVELLLRVKEIDINQKDKQDNTPLHAAVTLILFPCSLILKQQSRQKTSMECIPFMLP